MALSVVLTFAPPAESLGTLIIIRSIQYCY